MISREGSAERGQNIRDVEIDRNGDALNPENNLSGRYLIDS